MIEHLLSLFTNDLFFKKMFNLVLSKHADDESFNHATNFITQVNKCLINNNFQKLNIKNKLIFLNMIIESKLTFNKSVTYDNCISLLTENDSDDLFELLIEIKNERLDTKDDYTEFRSEILKELNIFKIIFEQKNTVKSLTDFINTNSATTPSLWVSEFNDIISQINNSLIVDDTIKKDTIKELVISKDSLEDVAININSFLKDKFSFIKTGYKFLDDEQLIESGTVSLIAAPTNHGKSLFLLNLLKNICELNDGDIFLYITLEDDTIKIIRRMISIFGNFSPNLVKKYFMHLHENNGDLTFLLDSIVTDFKKIKIIYPGENNYSAKDIEMEIKNYTKLNMKIGCVFFDYIDVAKANNSKYEMHDNYNTQGQVCHELRNVAKTYSVPIISVTQCVRSAEKPEVDLANDLLADSHRKARYVENIIMFRQNRQLSIIDTHMASDEDITIDNYIIVEMCLTKVKDGSKNKFAHLIFNENNLKFYENLSQFSIDNENILQNNSLLLSRMQT